MRVGNEQRPYREKNGYVQYKKKYRNNWKYVVHIEQTPFCSKYIQTNVIQDVDAAVYHK